MAALDRKNLVKDGKFNRAEIMKRAWAYVKNPFCTQYRNDFKGALKAAWVDAKMVKDEQCMDDEPKFNKKVNLYGIMRAVSGSVDMRRGTVCL